MEQKPSIGRTVIYNHSGSADKKFPPKVSPAIIQKVCLNDPNDENPEGLVDLVVFSSGDGQGIFFPVKVPFRKGEDVPGSNWSWPTRV